MCGSASETRSRGSTWKSVAVLVFLVTERCLVVESDLEWWLSQIDVKLGVVFVVYFHFGAVDDVGLRAVSTERAQVFVAAFLLGWLFLLRFDGCEILWYRQS